MKSNMKSLGLVRMIAIIMTFSYGFRVFWRGAFWTKEQDVVLHDSDFYVALHQIFPIWVWGVFVVTAGLILMISAVFIGSSRHRRICSRLLLIGGLMSGVLYFFMTSASIGHAINWLTPAHMAIMSASGLAAAFAGGIDLVERR